MDNLALAIVLFLCIGIGWLLGVVSSISEHPNVNISQNIVEIKDCKDIKLDTISYNFMDSTYVIQVKFIR